MSRFAVVYEDPEYELEADEDMDWQDVDNSAGEAVFKRIAEELSPFETVNS
jgi:predicted DNA binding CopG/RHH family protein